MKKKIGIMLLFIMIALSSCANKQEKKEIIRIGHNQSQNHPTHLGLLAFEEYIEKNLGDKYDVQVFPSELLGSQTDMVQLTQTGAINYCVASNAILETFDDIYEIFNLPYLFSSTESYHHVMNDKSITSDIYNSTADAGFRAVTWLDAGSRSFYTKDVKIEKPEDLKGLKIRVQQSPTNVEMMKLFGASASPMGFGEVYTALQSGIIDGAENNEMSLTDNGHGEVCKYYSYDMHQMVPDILIGNTSFIDNMSEEEKKVFEKGYEILNEVQMKEWVKAVENAKDKAQNDLKVEFNYPDQQAFKDTVAPLTKKVLDKNKKLIPYYEKIEEYNKKYPAKEG
ncbi:MAG: TRAP transporter substrate-binding protein [Tissierellia bacterium]|nr:TRAP transporter substrate-binding protein [Tissierellia bacterium]